MPLGLRNAGALALRYTRPDQRLPAPAHRRLPLQRPCTRPRRPAARTAPEPHADRRLVASMRGGSRRRDGPPREPSLDAGPAGRRGALGSGRRTRCGTRPPRRLQAAAPVDPHRFFSDSFLRPQRLLRALPRHRRRCWRRLTLLVGARGLRAARAPADARVGGRAASARGCCSACSASRRVARPGAVRPRRRVVGAPPRRLPPGLRERGSSKASSALGGTLPVRRRSRC